MRKTENSNAQLKPVSEPMDISRLDTDQLNAEIEKGYADMLAGRVEDVKQCFADLHIDSNVQRFDKTQATLRLMNELAKGHKSDKQDDWLTLEAVEEKLGIINE